MELDRWEAIALQSAGVGLWCWNVSTNKFLCDRQFLSLFDIDSEASLSSYSDFLNYIHPDNRSYVDKELKKITEPKVSFALEFRIITQANAPRFLILKGETQASPDEGLTLAGACWDVTFDRSRMDMHKIEKEATEKNSDIELHFLAKVSHDLRSPLNGIIGFAELMYQDKVGAVAPNHKQYLKDIIASGRLLLMLINDMLDLSKIKAAKMVFYPEKINLKAILDEINIFFRSIIMTKNIQLEIEVSPDLPELYLDPMRLRQIINNLVSNAFKFTGEGGKVTIRVYPKEEGWFCLEVEDTGIGVKKEHLSKLFREFEQIDSEVAKKYPGSGLGLALTKSLVEAQQGRVGVKSTFGKGSIFYAILPCNYAS